MGQLFGWIDKLLDGKKTLLGIIAGIATFVLLVTNTLTDGFQMADLQTILGGFSALMVAIGLGHKAEKIETALKK